MATKSQMQKDQTVAKRLFSRANNSLMKSIKVNDHWELVSHKFDDLKKRYDDLQEKHELYLLELEENPDFDATEQNEWMNEIQDEFDESERLCHDYKMHCKQSIKKDTIDESHEKEAKAKTRGFSENESFKNLRQFEKSELLNEVHKIERLMENTDIDELSKSQLLKEYQVELKKQVERCKNAQAQYLSTVESDELSKEIMWTNDIHDIYASITTKLFAMIKGNDKLPTKDIQSTQNKLYGLKLQPMPLPKFSGDIREYPRFKDDFKNQVMPSITDVQQPYVLKSCLSGQPLEIVKNVDHSISEMWKRLDEKYAEPSRVIDAILKEIKKLKSVKENDNNKFVQFVDTVERSYRDLKRLGLHNEISNASTVCSIEEKLPYSIRLRWGEYVKGERNEEYCDVNKFPLLLKFLIEWKNILEYVGSDVRSNESASGSVHFAESERESSEDTYDERYDCWYHQNNLHDIYNCPSFLQKTTEERFQIVRDNKICWSCLKPGHKSVFCRKRKRCSEDGCELNHHKLLHQHETQGSANHYQTSPKQSPQTSKKSCLLQLMKIKTADRGSVNVLWDGGATLSLITFKKAAELGLSGKEIKLAVTKVGGVSEEINSNKYHLSLIDNEGQEHDVTVYGIDKISTELKSIDLSKVCKLFSKAEAREIDRPCGEIDVLIGYEYAGYHPVKTECNDHLLLLENQFGKCLGGSHPMLFEKTLKIVKHAVLHHAKIAEIENFFDIENLGVQCIPRCGGCKCGTCSLGSSSCTIQEDREMQMIEKGLTRKASHWEASYPWTRDPSLLENNRSVIFAMLKSLERRLLKNESHAETYQSQISDMLERNVARKLSNDEVLNYTGPIQYISHHEVLKKDSVSTPCRIVFNSSAKFHGYSLNDCWAKGPDVINDMLGILLRFREGQFALAGDIKKMYHSVHLSTLDMHTHRFLWRDLDVSRNPDTYVMTRVSFGDKPAGAIATIALRRTALEHAESSPKAANSIIKNSYIDDILDSFDTEKDTINTATSINEILLDGGFEIKEWITSNNISEVTNPANVDIRCVLPDQSKILGMFWERSTDTFKFKIKLNFSPKYRKVKSGPDMTKEELHKLDLNVITKRSVLSQIAGIHDPFGFLLPFTVEAKIRMQQLWKNEAKDLGWDDILPKCVAEKWMQFFGNMFEAENLYFKRCIKPEGAVGCPMLILFSDASEEAFGTCAYIRWECHDGAVSTRLVAAKGKVAPIRITSLPRLELCASVLATRLYLFIQKECRFEFSKTIFVVDSAIVHAMIQRESYGFKTFVSVRLGEIQQSTVKSSWYWVDGENNIADWTTRPKHPSDLHENSKWQKGPSWLALNVDSWPLRGFSEIDGDLPEMKKHQEVLTVAINEVPDSQIIDLDRFSDYNCCIRVLARIIAIFAGQQKPSFSIISMMPSINNLKQAEKHLIKEAQVNMTDKDIQTRFKRLGARRREDGIIVVGARLEQWMKDSYNNNELILLPYDHRLSRLYVEMVHKQGHTGISATACKVRLRFWILKLQKIARTVCYNCVICRKNAKKCCEQIMGPLPNVRINPAPAWSAVSLDLFGPFVIRGEVNKRSRGKAYGLIINCLLTRAVHIDATPDYSTDSFLQALRRFMSFRGTPLKIFSDPGSQLQGAAKSMNPAVMDLNQEQLKEFGLKNGFEWHFTAACAPWQNGCSESLIASSKKAIQNAIGPQVLSIIELLTVFYECSNLLCERPIGMKTQDISEGSYLCPNDMLLGRASSRISSGPFDYENSHKKRYLFLQSIVKAFWIKWNRFYFPTLLVRQKWHVERRNLCIGDIVLMQDSNAIRGKWKLGRICDVFPSSDDKVRKVEVEYKNCSNNTGLKLPASFIKVHRPVQKLVLLLPHDEEGIIKTSSNGGGSVSTEN